MSGMSVIGIDSQTTNISWVSIDDKLVVPHRVAVKGRYAEDRFLPMMREFKTAFEACVFPTWGDLPFVHLEKPMLTRNAEATIYQSMVVGAIRQVLSGFGLAHSLVDPGVWKKGLLGTGKASKEEISAWVIAAGLLPAGLEQDLYDSCAIAQWGRNVAAR